MSDALNKLSACPGTQAPTIFLLSDATTTAHFPPILPSPFTIPVPVSKSSGLYRVFKGYQVPSSTSSATLSMQCFCLYDEFFTEELRYDGLRGFFGE